MTRFFSAAWVWVQVKNQTCAVHSASIPFCVHSATEQNAEQETEHGRHLPLVKRLSSYPHALLSCFPHPHSCAWPGNPGTGAPLHPEKPQPQFPTKTVCQLSAASLRCMPTAGLHSTAQSRTFPVHLHSVVSKQISSTVRRWPARLFSKVLLLTLCSHL